MRRYAAGARQLAYGTLLCAGVASCTSCGQVETTGQCRLNLPDIQRSAVEWVGSVRFCRQPPPQPERTSVQVLIDNSGSMSGFSAAIPPLYLWLRQGVSALVDSYVELSQFRACFFNTSFGIGECSGATEPLERPASGANTNLHQAITSAHDYGLTFIVTDGVAYTGAGTGDCGGGVDAACVARSLLEVLAGYSLRSPEMRGGLWLIPLASEFRGPFYSELPGRPSDFPRTATIAAVQQEVGRRVEIGRPRADRSGNLMYDYRGPKMWLLLIIAHDANLGRAAVQALWEQRATAQIQQIDSIAQHRNGVSAFQPIEVLPGYVPTLPWQLEPRETIRDTVRRRDRCGTIELEVATGSLRLRCQPGERAELLSRLKLGAVEQVSGCVDILQLAPTEFRLTGGEQYVETFALAWSSRVLDLHFVCQTGQRQQGSQRRLRLQAISQPRHVADCLANPSTCQASIAARVGSMSAMDPAAQPQRVFGLTQTLQRLLADVGQLPLPASMVLDAAFVLPHLPQ